jgi:hypothetical protein
MKMKISSSLRHRKRPGQGVDKVGGGHGGGGDATHRNVEAAFLSTSVPSGEDLYKGKRKMKAVNHGL